MALPPPFGFINKATIRILVGTYFMSLRKIFKIKLLNHWPCIYVKLAKNFLRKINNIDSTKKFLKMVYFIFPSACKFSSGFKSLPISGNVRFFLLLLL